MSVRERKRERAAVSSEGREIVNERDRERVRRRERLRRSMELVCVICKVVDAGSGYNGVCFFISVTVNKQLPTSKKKVELENFKNNIKIEPELMRINDSGE